MAEPGYNVVTEAKDESQSSSLKESLNPRPVMYGMDQSYTAGNQWYCYLPIESVLGNRYSNLDLHLTRFSLPQMEMASQTASFKGYLKTMPTKVLNAGTKELTLEYIVDEYWQNYKALWQWLSTINGVLNPVTDENDRGITPSEYITMRIYLLNNYKKKVIQFEFYNCWIRVFNDISLDVSNQDIVKHSFTFCYDSLKISEI